MRGKASYIDCFIYFLPVEWMKDVLLGITSENLEGSPVSCGKILIYLGLWILVSSVATGVSMRAYWDKIYPSPFKGAPFSLHRFMSFARFDAITKSLSFTGHNTPLYRYTF